MSRIIVQNKEGVCHNHLPTLPAYVHGLEPEVAVSSVEVIKDVEHFCKCWVEIIKTAIADIELSSAVHVTAGVCELPLEEVFFWKRRHSYLAPLGVAAGDKNGQVQWALRVISLISSSIGAQFRQSVMKLHRLFTEAKWNHKYLIILEKPFQILASGDMFAQLTILPGMSKTLKMIAQSSQFYNSLEHIENLVERVTLALCVHTVNKCNPSTLLRHGIFAVCLSGARYVSSEVSSSDEALENPLDALDSGIQLMERWCDCLLHKEPRNVSIALPDSCWPKLDFQRLVERPMYICDRCKDVHKILYSVKRFYHILEAKPSSLVETPEFEVLVQVVSDLNECSKQRVLPRIGVLPTGTEFIFEPRFSRRWESRRASLFERLAQLDEIS